MTQPNEPNATRAAPRSPVLFSLQTLLVTLLIAILLALQSLVWLGYRLTDGRALAAAVTMIALAGTFGELVRRRGQISLRVMLAGYTLIAVLLGLFAQSLVEARRQSAAVARLTAMGAWVGYDGRDNGAGWYRTKHDWAIPGWLIELAGADAFMTVDNIGFNGSSCQDADLFGLAEALPHLQEVSLRNSPITDAGLNEVAKLRELRFLHLDVTQLSARGLRSLRAAPSLEGLLIADRLMVPVSGAVHPTKHYGDFSDATIAGIGELKQLQSIQIMSSSVTEDSVNKLKEAMPGVAIQLN